MFDNVEFLFGVPKNSNVNFDLIDFREINELISEKKE